MRLWDREPAGSRHLFPSICRNLQWRFQPFTLPTRMCRLSNAGAATYLIRTIQELRSYLEKVAPDLADNLEDVFERMGRPFEPEQFSVVLRALLTGMLLGDGHNRADGTGASLVFQVSADSNASAREAMSAT